MTEKLIATSFPIIFANGYTVSVLKFWCTRCGRKADTDAVFGDVSRLTNNVADIWATYSCPCGHCEQYRIRLRDDKSCIYQEHGRWVKTSRKRLSVMEYLTLWAVGGYRFFQVKWYSLKLRYKLNKYKKNCQQQK